MEVVTEAAGDFTEAEEGFTAVERFTEAEATLFTVEDATAADIMVADTMVARIMLGAGVTTAGPAGIGATLDTVTDGDLVLASGGVGDGPTGIRTDTDITRGGTLLISTHIISFILTMAATTLRHPILVRDLVKTPR